MKKYNALIFARGGSKGIPNKNIIDLAGKPLIAYSIETAFAAKYIDKVIVSTDDDKIAKVAKEFGASVLTRPTDLATDNSPELLSWQHAIEQLSLTDSQDDLFISLPSTSPLRSPSDIDDAIEKFNRTKSYNVLFGITQSHRSPFLNMVKINDSDHIEIAMKGSSATRRQDVPSLYDVTTCIYVAKPDYILTCESIMDSNVGYIEIPVERSIDIDTYYDLHLASLLVKNPFKNIGVESV